jgi:hypothetical protein
VEEEEEKRERERGRGGGQTIPAVFFPRFLFFFFRVTDKKSAAQLETKGGATAAAAASSAVPLAACTTTSSTSSTKAVAADTDSSSPAVDKANSGDKPAAVVARWRAEMQQWLQAAAPQLELVASLRAPALLLLAVVVLLPLLFVALGSPLPASSLVRATIGVFRLLVACSAF